jgi:hypothetical protein
MSCLLLINENKHEIIHKTENNYTYYEEDAYRKVYVRTSSSNTVNEMHENLEAQS